MKGVRKGGSLGPACSSTSVEHLPGPSPEAKHIHHDMQAMVGERLGMSVSTAHHSRKPGQEAQYRFRASNSWRADATGSPGRRVSLAQLQKEPLSVIRGWISPPPPDFLPSSDVDPSRDIPFWRVEVKAPSICEAHDGPLRYKGQCDRVGQKDFCECLSSEQPLSICASKQRKTPPPSPMQGLGTIPGVWQEQLCLATHPQLWGLSSSQFQSEKPQQERELA